MELGKTQVLVITKRVDSIWQKQSVRSSGCCFLADRCRKERRSEMR